MIREAQDAATRPQESLDQILRFMGFGLITMMVVSLTIVAMTTTMLLGYDFLFFLHHIIFLVFCFFLF